MFEFIENIDAYTFQGNGFYSLCICICSFKLEM